MAGLKVFVSSTCYDLSVVRSQLRLFIQSLGHEPIMSDYNDILYDPRIHTHTSCIDEVATADVVVLIVGSRFGGKSVPEAIAKVDLDSLSNKSHSLDLLQKKENLSVTQLEILKAVESGIPIFTFIDSAVWHDHALYEKNKDNQEIISKIVFPSIDKLETASFIFEFINFLRLRIKGNSVFPFSKSQDIEEVLRRQWSALLQRLLQEQKNRVAEVKRIDELSEKFEDLKTAILTSIGDADAQTIARSTIRFRRLIQFVISMNVKELKNLIDQNISWEDLLNHAEIDRFIDANELSEYRGKAKFFLTKKNGTFYVSEISFDIFNNMSTEWNAFIKLQSSARVAILNAIIEIGGTTGESILIYREEHFDDYIRRHRDYISPYISLTELKMNDERYKKIVEAVRNGQKNWKTPKK